MKRIAVREPECFAKYDVGDPECRKCALSFDCSVKVLEKEYDDSTDFTDLNERAKNGTK